MLSKRFIKLLTLGAAAFMFCLYAWSDDPVRAASAGPTSARTGAPGETDCTACHTSFEVNSGDGSITLSGLPSVYSPGQEIEVTVTVNHPNGFAYGFQVTAIDQLGREAGNLVVTDAVGTQELNTIVDSNPRQYIEHTFDGIIPTEFDKKSWKFKWVTPATDVGPVTFYAAGNGANSNQEPTGDYIYTTSLALPFAAFDLCVQDDSGAGIFLINSVTGDYSFTNCNGVTTGGAGTLTRKGCYVTLQHVTATHRVIVKVDACLKKATASLQALGTGMTLNLIDRNTTNNTCACAK